MKTYTLNDVKQHNQKNDCWIVIKNKVYDVTEFLSEHPGGSGIILSVSGNDATEFFDELHRPEILEEYGNDYIIGHIVTTKL
jgi:L-lactate dehydrogenase (cytochrome)